MKNRVNITQKGTNNAPVTDVKKKWIICKLYGKELRITLLKKFIELQKHPERQQKKIKKTIPENNVFNKNTETIKDKNKSYSGITQWLIELFRFKLQQPSNHTE